MARKSKKTRTSQEKMYSGDSKDLKYYLMTKSKYYMYVLKARGDELSLEQKMRIKGYVDLLDLVLRLEYFKSQRCYTMPELIENIKFERADIKGIIETLEKDAAEARKAADEALKRENSYIASSFEDAYDTDGQKELRALMTEYDACKMQLDEYKRDWKSLWWLLGIINRPVGFFADVITE